MYLFCKFGFLYIRFTLSFSTEAFWAVVITCQTTLPTHKKVDDQSMAPRISSEELLGQNCGQKQQELKAGLLPSALLEMPPCSGQRKTKHNRLCWNDAVFMLSRNGNWTVFCNLWNSVLCFVKRVHEMVGPLKTFLPVLFHLCSLNSPQAQETQRSEVFRWRVVFW